MSLSDITQHIQSGIATVLASPTSELAYLAGAIGALLVVVSAFVRTMIPLRWLAVGSNVGFVIYGALQGAPITFIVAAALLVINIFRAVEMVRLTRRVHAADTAEDMTDVWLRPYMRVRKLRAGETLFHRGDLADHLYLLADGDVELVEIRHRLERGKIFGEIAFFAPDRRRTYTARCVNAGTVLMIDEYTVKQLYFQNPAFGFHLVGLIAGRLSADLERLRDQPQPDVATADTPTPPAPPSPAR